MPKDVRKNKIKVLIWMEDKEKFPHSKIDGKKFSLCEKSYILKSGFSHAVSQLT